MASSMGSGPLAGVRVLDLTDEKGTYCPKVLADLGADVIKVEPLGGDPTRQFAPFLSDAAPDPGRDLETSLYFAYFNAGKRSVQLDLAQTGDREALLDLVAGADILVESYPAGHLSGLGLGPDQLQARNSRLIVTSVAPYGQTGPHAGYRGNDLTAWASSGLMLVCGSADRPPLRAAGGQANILAAQTATVATLAALHRQRQTGQGQRVDVSMQEAGILQNEAVLLMYEYWGRFVQRAGQCQHPLAVPVIATRAADGFCQILTYSRAQWQALVAWLDEEGVAGDLVDQRWLDPATRFTQREHIHGLIAEFSARYNRQDLLVEAQKRGLAFGAIQTPAEIAADPALVERGFYVDMALPGSGRTVRAPGVPYRFSESEVAPPESPPLFPAAGRRIAWQESTVTESTPAPATPDGQRSGPAPLAGLRVLDFTWIVAGPFATLLLADLGADVIKVEAPGVGDPARALAPLHPDGTPPNNGGAWNQLNRGKRSITLNLADSSGRDLARRLAATADVVIENFSPGTFERLVGDPEEWRRENPGLIVVRMSGFGRTGVRSGYLGYAPTLQAMSGLSYLTAYDALQPEGLGTSYSDYIGGFAAAQALLAALHYRDRTGRGQTIEVSQLEALVATLGPAVLDVAANGQVQRPAGNRLAERPDAPQGVYRCRVPGAGTNGAGEDEAWIAIAVTSDAEWDALRRVIGDADWLAGAGLASATGRLAAAEAIDREVQAWTSHWHPFEAFAQLQAAGVPAGVVENGRDLLERDRHLAEREYFVTVDHPEIGALRLPGPAFRLDGKPAPNRRPPPLLGQHTEEVLRDSLGLTEEEISNLIVGEAV